MAIRFYLMPATIELRDESLDKFPKYEALYAGVPSQAIDYGREQVFLVAADVTGGIHNTTVANTDVESFPANLNNQIGAALNTVLNRLALLHIPSTGITATTTYRQLLRRVVRCFFFGQAMEGARFGRKINAIRSNLFSDGITLNSTWVDLPQEDRDVLLLVFNRFGFERGSLTAASTLREILISFMNQWSETQDITLLGVVI